MSSEFRDSLILRVGEKPASTTIWWKTLWEVWTVHSSEIKILDRYVLSWPQPRLSQDSTSTDARRCAMLGLLALATPGDPPALTGWQ